MKKLFVGAFWVLFGAGCKPQVVEKVRLPCDCKGMPITGGFAEPIRGQLLFPKIPTDPYAFYVLERNPEELYNLNICSDSTFTRLVKELKLADSTLVYLSKWGSINADGLTCKSLQSRENPPIRIIDMRKL